MSINLVLPSNLGVNGVDVAVNLSHGSEVMRERLTPGFSKK